MTRVGSDNREINRGSREHLLTLESSIPGLTVNLLIPPPSIFFFYFLVVVVLFVRFGFLRGKSFV